MKRDINNEEELNKSSSFIKVNWNIWVDSEVIQCELEDVLSLFNDHRR